jgi:hypothetical protein
MRYHCDNPHSLHGIAVFQHSVKANQTLLLTRVRMRYGSSWRPMFNTWAAKWHHQWYLERLTGQRGRGWGLNSCDANPSIYRTYIPFMSHLHRAVIRVNYRGNQGCIIHRCQGQKSFCLLDGINAGVANPILKLCNQEETVLTAQKEIKCFIFWDITPCSPFKASRRFASILNHQFVHFTFTTQHP